MERQRHAEREQDGADGGPPGHEGDGRDARFASEARQHAQGAVAHGRRDDETRPRGGEAGSVLGRFASLVAWSSQDDGREGHADRR